ncbi:hypothetical protein Poly51_55890 [Rubripirellula tenax]|uniref:Uncharacterized protein n=1 Tax=Rubripirellula tenax TaxID=2528015 RepID=A0A5C6ECM0_9BACT|nr:hypothetical protein [Rubripirellula tenax]TWU46194.1 hypothetical protein Poly51_55890 [Rubripirellula tenax]
MVSTRVEQRLAAMALVAVESCLPERKIAHDRILHHIKFAPLLNNLPANPVITW